MNRIVLPLLLSILWAGSSIAQKNKPQASSHLSFVAGQSFHVRTDEVLKITQQMSQVDSSLVEPSFRYTTYDFTENIDKVYPDGSADVSSTLDSIVIHIYVGEVKDQNEYFRFNSNSEVDLAARLRDIRALPRAQYLGQTLKYRLEPTGTIRYFNNLSAYQHGIIATAYEYEMMHAVLSYTDSLRIGQHLEQGSGALAALASGGKASLPYTMTEIHVTKDERASQKADTINYNATFSDPPQKMDYLEGIAFPITLKNFAGGMKGTLVFKGGIITSQTETDSASMNLLIDSEVIKNAVYRTVTTTRTPNKLLKGINFQVKDIKEHKPEPKHEDEMQSIELTPKHVNKPSTKPAQGK